VKKAVCYGAGRIFSEFHKELAESFDIVAVADQKFERSKNRNGCYAFNAISPNEITGFDFDVIVITTRYFVQVANFLVEQLGVEADRINFQCVQSVYGFESIQYNAHSGGGWLCIGHSFTMLFESQNDFDTFFHTVNSSSHKIILNTAKYVLLDVGFNIGCTSLWYARLPEVAKVFAYEPFEYTFRKGVANVRRNPEVGMKIDAFNIGLSNGGDDIIIKYMNCESKGANSVLPDHHNDTGFEEEERLANVNVRLIDAAYEVKRVCSLYPDSKIIMKIDTEGSEYDIFDSLENNHAKDMVDVFIVETHPVEGRSSDEILRFLKKDYIICMIRDVNNKWGTSEFTAIRKR